jgi:uncharacterized protein
MKININDIKENLGDFKEISLEKEVEDIDFQGREIKADKPAVIKLHIINTDDSFLITGTIDLKISVKCSRCLEKINLPLNVELEETISKDRVEVGTETVIDIGEELSDNIMVAIPMKTVCDEDCAGLCPSCGQNLNEGDCDCFMHTVDPRLAKLEKLLDND